MTTPLPQLDVVDPLQRLESAERALIELQHQLERTQRLATLGTLASTIAHEFNNLLTPMLGYAQYALGHLDDATLTKTALERTVTGAERASQIAASILAFATDDADAPIGTGFSNVAAVVQDALHCLARDPRQDGIGLTLRIDPNLQVSLPPAALQQVLLNLLLNACKAMPRGGQLIVEACGTWNGDLPAATIRVQDTGCGIDPVLLPHIFTPFVSAFPRAHEHKAGAGLGLAVCKQVVERAGGTIHVESAVGVGTTFTVTLCAQVAGSARAA
jgi:signal transduction histidine kinase